jgi:hypothetical protein
VVIGVYLDEIRNGIWISGGVTNCEFQKIRKFFALRHRVRKSYSNGLEDCSCNLFPL